MSESCRVCACVCEHVCMCMYVCALKTSPLWNREALDSFRVHTAPTQLVYIPTSPTSSTSGDFNSLVLGRGLRTCIIKVTPAGRSELDGGRRGTGIQ